MNALRPIYVSPLGESLIRPHLVDAGASAGERLGDEAGSGDAAVFIYGEGDLPFLRAAAEKAREVAAAVPAEQAFSLDPSVDLREIAKLLGTLGAHEAALNEYPRPA